MALAFLRRHLLVLLLVCYAAGALLPSGGAALRRWSVGTLHAFGDRLELSSPLLMLSLLLCSAGVATHVRSLRELFRRLPMVLAALVANAAVPIAFAFAVACLLHGWSEPEETQSMLMGLALLGAMPIAGASTAWAQNADGDLTLSLGLVLATTLASPATTPLVLLAVSAMTEGDYAEDLATLASGGTQLFLLIAVIVPSLAGLGVRAVCPANMLDRLLPRLKLLNLVLLLLLNYSNASAVLPRLIRQPDVPYVLLVFGIATALCALSFSAGALIARALKQDRSATVSMMFGLGMNNNGTALVLATAAVGDHQDAIAPILAYNLVQQIAAGLVDARLRHKPD